MARRLAELEDLCEKVGTTTDAVMFLESAPDFCTIAARGHDDVLDAQKRLAHGETKPTDPPTIGDHVRFLENVRDEVRYAAEAKRNQFAHEYANDTLARLVSGIKWSEANDRIALLTDLPAEVVNQVAGILRRELIVGTVERIDELLAPAVGNLRDAYEESRVTAELETLFVALLDAAMPVAEDEKAGGASEILDSRMRDAAEFDLSRRPGLGVPGTATLGYADAAFRAKVQALERIIEKRCRQRMLAAGFRDEEMQGLNVPCLPAHVKSDDPRWHAYRAAFERLKLGKR